MLQQMLQETKYTAVIQLWQKSYSGWLSADKTHAWLPASQAARLNNNK